MLRIFKNHVTFAKKIFTFIEERNFYFLVCILHESSVFCSRKSQNSRLNYLHSSRNVIQNMFYLLIALIVRWIFNYLSGMKISLFCLRHLFMSAF